MKRKKNQCRVCRFFKDVSKSAPWWQRACLEFIAKAAREHPEAHGYALLDFMEADKAKLDKLCKGGGNTDRDVLMAQIRDALKQLDARGQASVIRFAEAMKDGTAPSTAEEWYQLEVERGNLP